MSALEFLTLFSMPIAGLIIAAVFYYTSRPRDNSDRESRHRTR